MLNLAEGYRRISFRGHACIVCGAGFSRLREFLFLFLYLDYLNQGLLLNCHLFHLSKLPDLTNQSR